MKRTPLRRKTPMRKKPLMTGGFSKWGPTYKKVIIKSGSTRGKIGKPWLPLRKPLPQQSPKRKLAARIYSAQRKTFLAQYKVCAAYSRPQSRCTIVPTDVHHTAGRTGKNFLDVSKWLPVCRACHQWIHENPKAARLLNLLK